MDNKKLGFWLAWVLISAVILVVLVSPNNLVHGGDVVEYYGIAKALTNHQTLNIQDNDLVELRSKFGRVAVDNPEYFLVANDGKRYATHFWLYSVLLWPFQLGLDVRAFSVLNWIIFTLVNGVILLKYLPDISKKILFVILVYFSPLIYFLSWTGVEVYTMSWLMLGLFVFFDKRRWLGVMLMGVASWQSLPLVTIPIFFGIADLVMSLRERSVSMSWVIKRIVLAIIVIFPNIYYYWLFRTYHAQAKLPGMGLSINWQRILEVVFDLNIGLLWYWPVAFILGYWSLRKKWWLILPILIAEIVYSATTNWNHGTAGYGPSRYALLFIPFWVWLILNEQKKRWGWVTVYVILQFWVILTNGGLLPNSDNSFKMNSLARLVLNKYPKLYNPTFDVFVRRTENMGIYKDSEGKCKKAILYKWNDESLKLVENECQINLDENIIKDKKVWLRQGTLWPEETTCTGPGGECLKNLEMVSSRLNIAKNRLEPIEITYGAWKISKGTIVKINVPEGYRIDYDPWDGVYINF